MGSGRTQGVELVMQWRPTGLSMGWQGRIIWLGKGWGVFFCGVGVLL